MSTPYYNNNKKTRFETREEREKRLQATVGKEVKSVKEKRKEET
jgi:hypothetical protein